MLLVSLAIRDFRNLATVDLACTGRCVLFHGDNGAGKTSLLEALHVLSTGRSFRTRLVEPLIRSGADRFVVRAGLDRRERRHVLGIERSRRRTRRRLDGVDALAQSALTSLFPVQVIHPDTHLLISAGPAVRRRFLDWGCFYHAGSSFTSVWTRFSRIGRQRARALREGAPSRLLASLDEPFVTLAGALDRYRREYLQLLLPAWRDVLESLDLSSSLPGLDIVYLSGWPEDMELADVLVANRMRDRRLGRTHAGPHRASLHVLSEGHPASRVLSRGQQKLVALSLVLAQLQVILRDDSHPPLLMVDDLASELDRSHRKRVISHLSALPIQLFFTAVDSSDLLSDGLVPDTMFHVKHGQVEEVV